MTFRRQMSMGLWPIIAMVAAGSAFIYFKLKDGVRRAQEARMDDMVDQSFPASDAPSY